MPSGTDLEIQHNEPELRFEVIMDGHHAMLQYVHRPGGLTELYHTEVPAALEGKGVGSALAHAALEDARARGLTVIPSCPFVQAYLRRHSEYLDIVEAGWRAQLQS